MKRPTRKQQRQIAKYVLRRLEGKPKFYPFKPDWLKSFAETHIKDTEE